MKRCGTFANQWFYNKYRVRPHLINPRTRATSKDTYVGKHR